jgi:hypothetical protein
MKRLQQLSAMILFAVLSFSIAPKELLHDFFHDHETVDFICHDECTDHLSAEHQHCELLQLGSPVFYHDITIIEFSPTIVANRFLEISTEPQKFFSAEFLFFRGPPSLI